MDKCTHPRGIRGQNVGQCPDTQHQEKSWSIFVRRCKEKEMSSKKGGDVFAPKNSAQADGDNAGLGKIPEILYVFYTTLIDEAGF